MQKNLKLGVLLIAAAISTAACKESSPTAGKDEHQAATQAHAPKPPSLLDRLNAMDFGKAVETLKPFMKDTADTQSKGTLLLGVWAAKHLKWSDVHVHPDETSFGMVMKDSAAERGKRMCWSGTIIQIEKDDTGEQGGSLFSGLLITRREDIINFFAAGSTGRLVSRSYARFCGVVTQRYDYSNSGGGTGHAVDMVGMFRLRQNIKK